MICKNLWGNKFILLSMTVAHWRTRYASYKLINISIGANVRPRIGTIRYRRRYNLCSFYAICQNIHYVILLNIRLRPWYLNFDLYACRGRKWPRSLFLFSFDLVGCICKKKLCKSSLGVSLTRNRRRRYARFFFLKKYIYKSN